jgi:hypothetical protein
MLHKGEVRQMNNDQFEREKQYQLSLSVAKTMLHNGVISSEEYSAIDTILRAKYLPIIGAICRA